MLRSAPFSMEKPIDWSSALKSETLGGCVVVFLCSSKKDSEKERQSHEKDREKRQYQYSQS